MPPVKKATSRKAPAKTRAKAPAKPRATTSRPKAAVKKAVAKVTKPPEPKPRRSVVEVAIHGDGGDVFVRREPEEVWLKWLHGMAFRFKPEDLNDALYYIDEFGTRSWVQLSDSFGDGFVALVESNVLYINSDPAPTDNLEGIPWEHLQGALEEAVT